MSGGAENPNEPTEEELKKAGIAKAIADHEALTAYFITKVTDKVSAKMMAEENRWHRLITIVLAIVAVGGLGSVYAGLWWAADNAVETKMGKIIEVQQKFERDWQYQQLVYLGFNLDAAQAITGEDRDRAMKLLRWVSEQPTLREREDLLSALTHYVRGFREAMCNDEINEVFDLFEKEMVANYAAGKQLSLHYGPRLVLLAHPDSRDSDEYNDVRRRFVILQGNMGPEKGNYAEVALPFHILHECLVQGDGWETDIEKSFEELRGLQPGERQYAFVLFISHGQYEGLPDHVEGAFRRFLRVDDNSAQVDKLVPDPEIRRRLRARLEAARNDFLEGGGVNWLEELREGANQQPE